MKRTCIYKNANWHEPSLVTRQSQNNFTLVSSSEIGIETSEEFHSNNFRMKSKIIRNLLFSVLAMLFSIQVAFSKNKEKIAVIGIDTKNFSIENEVIRNIILLELEKANVYEVMDKYDLADVIQKEGIDIQGCYGLACQVRVGKLLAADKMLTGSIERFGDKIIILLRLIDVKSGRVEKTDVMEYLNQPAHIQVLLRLSLNNIMDIKNDKALLDLLISYDQPIITSKTTLKLNGPRVGATYGWGDHADRMQAPENNGGFNMYPVNSLIGYQFEQQFLSSGDFQALVEFIPALTGMESGVIVPSASILLGFRFSNSGFEIGMGPNLKVTQTAYGYYDSNGNWNLAYTLHPESTTQTVKRLDNRGSFDLSTAMVFAIGKTFKSGYLNVPVNVYYIPNKAGSFIGLIVGFNVARLPRMDSN